MTEVKIRNRAGIYEISAEGHATGSVEVCAAVSTLMTGLANYAIKNLNSVVEGFENGNASVTFYGEGAAHIYGFICEAFEMLADSEPEYIKIIK